MHLAIILLLNLTPSLAWDHLDRKHPTHRTLPSFRWTRPFLDLDLRADNPHATSPADIDRDVPAGHHVYCEATGVFAARQFTLADREAQYPRGLAPFAAAEVAVTQRAYPGGWDGEDLEGDEMVLLVMEYKDVPIAVREFLEQQGTDGREATRWMFGVFDKPGSAVKSAVAGGDKSGHVVNNEPSGVENKVMVFAPGAMYDILPLWVADGSPCRYYFLDLDRYTTHAAHNKVIAWPMARTQPDGANSKNEIIFDIRAALLTETTQGRRHRRAWEQMHVQALRAERRLQKEERLVGKGRHRHGGGHDHDEL